MVQDFFKNLTKMALKTFLDLKIMWQWKVKNLEVVKFHPTKGQLISKANWQAEDSPKKRTNEFVFTTVAQVFSFVFWENPRLDWFAFEINWPLAAVIRL